MERTGHTAPPYKVVEPHYKDEKDAGHLCVQIGEDDLYTTGVLRGADARFIVLACNAHADLLALLQHMLQEADRAGYVEFGPDYGDHDLFERVKAVVAKATGQG